jgi:hypothetical protein
VTPLRVPPVGDKALERISDTKKGAVDTGPERPHGTVNVRMVRKWLNQAISQRPLACARVGAR